MFCKMLSLQPFSSEFKDNLCIKNPIPLRAVKIFKRKRVGKTDKFSKNQS